MLSEDEKKDIEQAVSNVLSGIDIESSSLILEKVIMDNYIISRGRVNILKIATRQILNFIEEYKNKGYLDVVREKVKANEEITKLQKEIEHQKEKRENQKAELTILNEKQKEMNKLINNVKSYKGQIKKLEHTNKSYKGIINKKDKEIEELKQALARNIAKNFTSSMKESAKSKEDLEMLNKGWQIELEKKNKQIDLMAKAMDKIQDPQVCKYCDNNINSNHGYCVDAGKCKEGIKQYFERKVRDER